MRDNDILKGIRILDFTWVLAGPFATRLLGDFGAEVIKVHPMLPEADDAFSCAYYNTWNRSKLSITLNMNDPEGRSLARQLAAKCDVVAENFTPRVMENWGFNYPNLKKIKPDIIMLSMSALGHDGPRRDYAGFGPTIQAFSGMTYLTSYENSPPRGIGFSYSDHAAALYGSLSVLAALERRRQTGEGTFIDLSQLETTCSLMADELISASGKQSGIPEPPYEGIFRCNGEDRWCAISVFDQQELDALKAALGNPPEIQDINIEAVKSRRKRLDSFVQGWTMQRTPSEAMDILQQSGVRAGAVQDAADVLNDPHLSCRGFFRGASDGSTGDVPPIRFQDFDPSLLKNAPEPGSGSDYVYSSLLGLSAKEIDRLSANKVI
jgi:benzylsuccinate CoA-transferase BbsF subunit